MKFWRNETKKKANFRRTTQSKSASSESPSQQKISTAYRFSSIKSWVECWSFYLSFPLSVQKTTLTCISRFCEGLNGVYRQTYPGCRRLFVRDLQFWSSLKLLSSACGRRNEAPRRTREKPLVPRVRQPSNGLQISRQPSKTSKYFKSLYFS